MACADACVKKCISYVEDQDGFYMPVVNKQLCVNCKRCEQVCPVLNSKVNPFTNHKCYSAYHSDPDVRRNGSSGSIFFSLAEFIILKGGSVYGASLDNKMNLFHTRATTIEEVRRQMKSKYIQSYTKGIYSKVLCDLQNGLDVLFVGTPCQCRALYNLIPSRLREKLLLVDILCHGVPSQSLFTQAIKHYENIHSCRVLDFSFREKTFEKLRCFRITWKNKEGKTISKIDNPEAFPYYFGFTEHLTLRNSCYKCPQRGIERVSDITLGDFWGINIIKPEIKDYFNGYSVVITNTDKGNSVLEIVKSIRTIEIPEGIGHVKLYNHAYTKKDKKIMMRYFFFWTYRVLGYPFCERHFLRPNASLFDRLFHSVIYRIDKLI